MAQSAAVQKVVGSDDDAEEEEGDVDKAEGDGLLQGRSVDRD